MFLGKVQCKSAVQHPVISRTIIAFYVQLIGEKVLFYKEKLVLIVASVAFLPKKHISTNCIYHRAVAKNLVLWRRLYFSFWCKK